MAFRRALRRATPRLARSLPWSRHDDPWAILVSEVMLQQTPVGRVLEPWRTFLERFPTPSSCAAAPLSQIIAAWRGLGYPRRARALHDAARIIVASFNGAVPRDRSQLLSLPGVGEYTASAVASFAFAERVAVIDTNVGRVIARALTNAPLGRRDAIDVAASLLPRSDVAGFNQAMIDLGSQFCRARPLCSRCPVSPYCRWRRVGGPDPAPTSAAVSRPQPKYRGSNRELRGQVLRALEAGPRSSHELAPLFVNVEAQRRRVVVEGLVSDGLVSRRGSHYALGAP